MEARSMWKARKAKVRNLLSSCRCKTLLPRGRVRQPAGNGGKGFVRHAYLRNPTLNPPQGGNRASHHYFYLYIFAYLTLPFVAKHEKTNLYPSFDRTVHSRACAEKSN